MHFIAKLVIAAVALPRVYQAAEKSATFEAALAAARSSGKPLLNAGCGGEPWHWMSTDIAERSDVNIDIVPRNVPNFVQADLSDLSMFEDKTFGAAFCSHVIEHVDDPEAVAAELDRVADQVFILTPRWWDILTYLNPNHKWVAVRDGYVAIK
jgi:SAM-dependent methyltransferase